MATFLSYFLVDLIPVIVWWALLAILIVPICLGFAPLVATILCQEVISRIFKVTFPLSNDDNQSPALPDGEDDGSEYSIMLQPILFPDINGVKFSGSASQSNGASGTAGAQDDHFQQHHSRENCLSRACQVLHTTSLQIKVEGGIAVEIPALLRYFLLFTLWWVLAFAGTVYLDRLLLDSDYGPESCVTGRDCFPVENITRGFQWNEPAVDCRAHPDELLVCYSLVFNPGEAAEEAVGLIGSAVVIVALVSLLQVYAKYFLIWCYQHCCLFWGAQQFFWCCTMATESIIFGWQVLACLVTVAVFVVAAIEYEPLQDFLLSDIVKLLEAVALVFTVLFTILTPWHLVELRLPSDDKKEGGEGGETTTDEIELTKSQQPVSTPPV